ncbi:MAG TPA: energy transducer TonB [Acidobacteriota bacterium]|jgi:TonB family protein
MGSQVLSAHTQIPGLRRSLFGSVVLHLALLLFILVSQGLSHPDVLILGTGPGGGQGGETLQVSLAGALDGGTGELFKPSLKTQPPAPPIPAVVKKSAEAPPTPEDLQILSHKSTKAARPLKPASTESAETQKAPTLTPELLMKVLKDITGSKQDSPQPPANQIPRETGPGAGGAGRASGTGGGFGGGQGIHIGQGSGGDPAADSWYARQVEKRIGENWLRTNFESLAGRRLTAVIRFDIQPDGRINNVVMEQDSGVTFYNLSAERAIRSSTPLPRPPSEFQNRTIRFICYFEYPPEKGR